MKPINSKQGSKGEKRKRNTEKTGKILLESAT